MYIYLYKYTLYIKKKPKIPSPQLSLNLVRQSPDLHLQSHPSTAPWRKQQVGKLWDGKQKLHHQSSPELTWRGYDAGDVFWGHCAKVAFFIAALAFWTNLSMNKPIQHYKNRCGQTLTPAPVKRFTLTLSHFFVLFELVAQIWNYEVLHRPWCRDKDRTGRPFSSKRSGD